MLTIALGVCLGIVAAVYLLNWLGRIAEWRAERRERRAYAKMLRQYAATPDQQQNQATDRVIGMVFVAFVLIVIGLPLVNAAMH